jgi:hypothetical protein
MASRVSVAPRLKHPGLVDGAKLFGESVSRQPRPVGAEGVRFQNLGASLDVVQMDVLNQRGLRQIQLIVGTIDEDSLGVQDGPHGAVGHHRAAGELFAEFQCSVCGHALILSC